MDALGHDFKMSSFDKFCERLTREQSKLQQLDALPSSSNEDLVAHISMGKQ